MRYLCEISYDGYLFYGFQRQKDKRTVCSLVEEVLRKVLNENILIVGASRTDRGVHANSFYFHFDCEKVLDTEKLKVSLNKLISNDIYFKNITIVNEDFHARYSVKSKEYVYVINMGEYNPTRRNYELEYNKKINIKLLKKASKYLVGEHDFKSFTSDSMGKSTVRRINYIKFKKNKELLIISIEANGFLKYMIRNIIGLFLEINENKKTPIMTKEILESKDRTKLGIKAPSSGLYLNKIKY
ncbi:MAG: tRNA pseudouridine(38-40) synthase TruA [Tenericutes bacterium]|nr:tRNA pseudouridine(38-40) synthase TruA [Mycoplasmatota bacterium]